MLQIPMTSQHELGQISEIYSAWGRKKKTTTQNCSSKNKLPARHFFACVYQHGTCCLLGTNYNNLCFEKKHPANTQSTWRNALQKARMTTEMELCVCVSAQRSMAVFAFHFH